MNWKIPLFKIHNDQDDIDAVVKVIKRGTFWATGPEVEEFEDKLAKFIGKKYCLAFNSGTSALHTLLLSHNIAGKEVIVPSFTFIATVNAVVLAGGIPVFADVEEETYALDYDDVKSRITERTAAIIPIHYGGFPARDIEKLRKLADERGLLLIEDAAQSIGSHIDGKMVGNFGHSSMFSLCQNKILPTGEGGLLLTDSEEVYEKAKLLRSHGRVEETDDYFSNIGDNDYVQVGFNFRMPTMVAALGLSQFKKIDRIISKRRRLARKFNERLSRIKGIQLRTEFEKHFQVYQMYSFLLSSRELRDDLQEHLKSKEIMSKVYFFPIHEKTIYLRDDDEIVLPNTSDLADRALNIPLYPDMTDGEMEFLLSAIEEFFEE